MRQLQEQGKGSWRVEAWALGLAHCGPVCDMRREGWRRGG